MELKDKLFNADKSDKITFNDSKLMEYFQIDYFVKHLFSKESFIEYLKELLNNNVPAIKVVNLINYIDKLEVKYLGSIFCEKQKDNSITMYFYQDDTSVVLKKEK